MDSVNLRLKRLREEAGLTVRALAEHLGMPYSTYAAYEDVHKFKKKHLPIDLAKRLANVLKDHGVEPMQVLALAGIDQGGVIMPTPEDLAKQLGFGLVPELELGYSMGGGAVFDDYRHVGIVPFPMDWLRTIMRA